MQKRFEGQVVLITGGARGIGMACAQRFADEGANIAVVDLLMDEAEAIAKECRDKGVEAIGLKCDVTDEDSVKAAFDAAMEKWGRVDTVVASAGIHTGAPVDQVELKTWKKAIDINLTGVFLTNKYAAAIMKKQKSGSIINISSMAGVISFPATSEYSGSKSGVIGLTRSVAQDLAPFGVTCNAICPGNTLTAMVKEVARTVGSGLGMTADEWLQMRANDCPMKRLAEPWEMAGVVAFLASQDSRYLTAQAIVIDGGITATA